MMPTSWSPPPPPGFVPAQASPPTNYGYPQANPAYTPVQIRQGFGQFPPPPPPNVAYGAVPPPIPSPAMSAPPPPPANGVSAPPPGRMGFPEPVRQYVSRAFLPSNMHPSVSRTDVEAKLKEIVTSAMEGGLMFSTNWDAMKSPTAIIMDERQAASTSSARKRKSSGFGDDDAASSSSSSPAPWRAGGLNGSAIKNNNSRSLEDRISFASPDKSKSQKQMEKRQRRWANSQPAPRSPTPPPSDGPVVGTCENLEKRYLRLTSAPVPSLVRPERVLHKTVDLLKKKWRQESNYSYICDQLKSVRQDLTVQHIKNDFTVRVYELHARIALEKGDLGEYNQCQTQLRVLYGLGLKGNPLEFKAYRILYFIHTANRTGLNDAMADLTPAEKEEPPIRHALGVRSALALGNYHRFFQLYLDTPNMGAYLMDMFVVRERLAALCNICKAYKPDVKLRFITEELGFESDHDAAQFIVDYQGQGLLEERGDSITLLTGKAGQLFETARQAAFRTVDIKGQI